MSNSSGPDEQSSSKKPLGLDEWVAIIVAFLAIGSIFAWSISPRPGGWRWPFADQMSPADSLVTSDDLGNSSPTELSPEDSSVTAKTPADERPISLLPPATTIPGLPQPSEEVYLPRTKKPQRPAPTDSTDEPPETPAPTDSTTESPETPETPREGGVEFKDVPDGFWAGPFIKALVERDLFDGGTDGNFQPNAPMTRAEYAVALEKAFKQDPIKERLIFQDVLRDDPAGEPIKRSTETGFLSGYPGEIFRPNQRIPRVQVLVSLANGLGLKAPPNPNQILGRYQDASRLPDYSLSAVAAATKAGLVVNYPNPDRINPTQAATRADVASLIHQALVIQGKIPEISSEYIVQPD